MHVACIKGNEWDPIISSEFYAANYTGLNTALGLQVSIVVINMLPTILQPVPNQVIFNSRMLVSATAEGHWSSTLKVVGP